MTSLKALCQILEKCTQQIEEEIKISINDMHNLVTSNNSSDVRVSLEKAKDYHYKEIMNVLTDIISKIRIILFHEEKILSLSDEKNFTPQDLKRYSYVQRQVNAFSKAKSTSDLSTTSPEDGAMVTKREKRRVASEISVESLDAWEKYLDQKSALEKLKEQESRNKVDNEKVIEASVEPVKRNNKSSARRRKKFVSSTLDGFLEGARGLGGGGRKLESILEDGSLVVDVKESPEETTNSNESLPEYYKDVNELNINKNTQIRSYSTDSQNQICENNTKNDTDSCGMNTADAEGDSSSISSSMDDCDVPLMAVMAVGGCSIIKASEINCPKEGASITKPRIIDVIYKKKPS